MAKVLIGNQTIQIGFGLKDRTQMTNIDYGFMIVRKIECVISDQDEEEMTLSIEEGDEGEMVEVEEVEQKEETCLPGYQIYPCLYIVIADIEGEGSMEFVAIWDESEQEEIYIALDNMPSNYELHNYEFHQRLNRCCNEKELSLPDYLETHAFNPDSVKNMLVKNLKGKWDFMNGREKDREYLNFKK